MNVRQIKELVRQYNLGISPRRLGQHFLVDSRILARIAAVVGPSPQDRVLEIGAGLGALTDHLAASGAQVYAVEKDPRFLQVLADRFKSDENLQLVRSDILRMDLGAYATGEPKSLLVVGNIPYSLTSPILEFLLRQRGWVKRAVLTVQKEVALRIVASPGGKAYSSISLLVQVAFRPSIAFSIAPGAFYPQPKVTSAVLRLDPLAEPVVAADEEDEVLRLGRRLFNYRRKTLLNALIMGGVSQDKERLQAGLRAAGIDPARRPETLTLPDLVALHRRLR